MDESDIKRAVDSVASLAGADYPTIAERLKDAGLEGYSTDVGASTIVYRGGGATHTEQGEPVAPGGQPPPGAYDEAAVREALQAIQREEIDYDSFLQRLWAAGVTNYEVDLIGKRISFNAPDGRAYVESIPEPPA